VVNSVVASASPLSWFGQNYRLWTVLPAASAEGRRRPMPNHPEGHTRGCWCPALTPPRRLSVSHIHTDIPIVGAGVRLFRTTHITYCIPKAIHCNQWEEYYDKKIEEEVFHSGMSEIPTGELKYGSCGESGDLYPTVAVHGHILTSITGQHCQLSKYIFPHIVNIIFYRCWSFTLDTF
jgi:hypothetical protein